MHTTTHTHTSWHLQSHRRRNGQSCEKSKCFFLCADLSYWLCFCFASLRFCFCFASLLLLLACVLALLCVYLYVYAYVYVYVYVCVCDSDPFDEFHLASCTVETDPSMVLQDMDDCSSRMVSEIITEWQRLHQLNTLAISLYVCLFLLHIHSTQYTSHVSH